MMRGRQAGWPSGSIRLPVIGAAVLVLAATVIVWRPAAVTGPGGKRAGEHEVGLAPQGDPRTTMSVSWSCDDPAAPPPAILYRAEHARIWILAAGSFAPWAPGPRRLHRVELTGLSPDTRYHFIIRGEEMERGFHTGPRQQWKSLTCIVTARE